MIPYVPLSVFFIGPIPIQVWGLCVAAGFLLTVFLLRTRASVASERDLLLSLAVSMIVYGFLGARLVHVGVYEPARYLAHPLEIFMIWHGGFSSFGGFLGAAVAFLLFAKKQAHVRSRVAALLDSIMYSAVYGWMVGRLGCVLIHDHKGIACPNCALAFQFPDGARLDMAFLEILGLLPLALWLFFTRKYSMKNGFRSAVIWLYYACLRFVLDFFRARDIVNADVRYLGLTPAQYFAILFIILTSLFLVKLQREKRGEFA